MASMNYSDYFDIDEDYWPCVDESAINGGKKWETTYPHETFISLLNMTEKMLGGSTKRSLWIHGAYGTGKSLCAFALKKILEVPEEELRAYWEKYETLKNQQPLLQKLIGHKKQGIVTVHRYASGGITTPSQLFFAVQESIKHALEESGVAYKGENSLRESVIAWLEDPIHATMMDQLLQRPRWESAFSQSSSEQIINTLRKNSDVTSLMNNIFKLAAAEGITAMNLTSDSLKKWIQDIIHQNNIKIVFVWDEFSSFFKRNANSLDEFQNLVSICQEDPFYLIIVTHPLSSLTQGFGTEKTNPWTVVQQRFDKVEITLPPNIAFELIGDAYLVKEAAKGKWEAMTGELDSRVVDSKKAVVKAAAIKSERIVRKILPLHPMAALVLKNIASAFQSNQRSMFDFIKTPKDLDTKAFQWFIQHNGLASDRPLLTVDMLWDFFYEKGKEYLSQDIRMILDTFPQQKQLKEVEKIVLKAILILQAIDLRLGGTIPLLKPTDQTLSYVFEGDSDQLQNECKSIAKGLVSKGILIENPLPDNKKAYGAAILAGDGAKIDGYKKEIREKGTTTKLIEDCPGIGGALALTAPLRLRFALDIESGYLPTVTEVTFVKTMDALKAKGEGWHFFAVLAVAKTEEEAQRFRILIKKTMENPDYQNITVIDTLSTPLTLEAFEQYVNFAAMSQYYSGNNGQESKKNAKDAKDVIERAWRDRIHDGQFIIWTYAKQDEEKVTGAAEVHKILQAIVRTKYGFVQDFAKGLTESQLKLSQAPKSAKYGISEGKVEGIMKNCDSIVLGKVWGHQRYWEDTALAGEPIVVIKQAVQKLISDAFLRDGRISIGTIYDYLETHFGFSQCNLSCFLTGFLLKEYSRDPYRYMDTEGHRDDMTPDKLAEMIGGLFSKNPKAAFIVSLTEEEKAFYELTETAWDIDSHSCSSPSQVGAVIQKRMQDLKYPVWCLEEVDTQGSYDLVSKFMRLVQSQGDAAHTIANEIGRIALHHPSAAQNLKDLLTQDNCQKGMRRFLQRFDDRRLIHLADEIGAGSQMMSDIKNLFDVQYSALWRAETGENEIRKLTVQYEVILLTNRLLNVGEHTLDSAFKKWREKLKFIGFSCEAICTKRPELSKLFQHLRDIAEYKEILPDGLKELLKELDMHFTEIREIIDQPLSAFMEIYAPYLEGFSEVECEEIMHSITAELFTASATSSNGTVKKAADDFKKNQLKSQLFMLWRTKADGTKTPREWSDRYQMPILICVDSACYSDAKKTFDILNSSAASETEIKFAINFVENANFFEDIADPAFRDRRFMERIVGDYCRLLPDVSAVKAALEPLGISPFDWADNPNVQQRIEELAKKEYDAGGSDQVIEQIQTMSGEELRQWLTDVVKKDMGLGVRIIINGKG